MIERVRLLIRQVGEAVPAGAGRQQRIARKLGISPSLLSKIELEKKSRLQDDTISAILEALKLDPAFLFDDSLGPEPDHREYIRKRSSAAAPKPPHWDAFAAHWHRFHELTPREREGIQRTLGEDGLHEIRDWTDWIPVAEWVLARRRRTAQS